MKEHRFSWILAYLERGNKYDPPSCLHQNHPRAINSVACLDNDLRGPVDPTDSGRPGKCPITTESFQLSPTREQVDDYMRLLESQIKRKDVGIALLPSEKRRGMAGTAEHLLFKVLFFAMLALVLGCSAWLLQVMYEAFS